MDLIEKIGPFVGLAAFVGLAVLAFLLFQQSRDLRRLREWAGRAPERAKEAADASLAAAEARGEETARRKGPGRLLACMGRDHRLRGVRATRAFDRHLPIDGRIILGVLGAAVIAAGVLTSGFGLVGDDGDGGGTAKAERRKEDKPKVAVLNATQTDEVVRAFPGSPTRSPTRW